MKDKKKRAIEKMVTSRVKMLNLNSEDSGEYGVALAYVTMLLSIEVAVSGGINAGDIVEALGYLAEDMTVMEELVEKDE